MYRHIKLTCAGRLARVTLDRPERRNAFSAELMREMIAAAAELAARRDVDAVVVSGSGGVFSAGADLKDGTRWAGGAPLLEQRETSGLGGRMARAWRAPRSRSPPSRATPSAAGSRSARRSTGASLPAMPLFRFRKFPSASRSPGAPFPAWSTSSARPAPSASPFSASASAPRMPCRWGWSTKSANRGLAWQLQNNG